MPRTARWPAVDCEAQVAGDVGELLHHRAVEHQERVGRHHPRAVGGGVVGGPVLQGQRRRQAGGAVGCERRSWARLRLPAAVGPLNSMVVPRASVSRKFE